MNKLTHEEFKRQLAELQPFIELVGEYRGAIEKVLCNDLRCDCRPYLVRAADAKRGRRCSHCRYNRASQAQLKSHEQFVSDARDALPHIEVLGQYKGAKQMVLVNDSRCSCPPYKAVASAVLSSATGCQKCGAIRRGEKQRTTHDEFVYRLKGLHPHFEVLDRYVKGEIQILVNDTRCDCPPWKGLAQNLLKGHGCAHCWKRRAGESNLKSHEEFVEELRFAAPHIELLSQYIGCSDPILANDIRCKCPSYNVSNSATLLRGYGCPQCMGNRIAEKQRISHDEFVERLSGVQPHIDVLSEYSDYSRPIELNDTRCDCPPYETMPNNAMQGSGCSHCHYDRIGLAGRVTHEEFIERVAGEYPYLTVVGNYKRMHQPIEMNDTRCDCSTFFVQPTKILTRGARCYCINESRGEARVRLWLQDHGICFERQKTFPGCIHKGPLAFDFFLPVHKVLIEYDGRQHFKPIKLYGGDEALAELQYKDSLKNEWAAANGFRMLRIPFTEFENVHQILESAICNQIEA